MKRIKSKLRAWCALFDLQDCFLLGGAVLVPAGIALMYVPAGLIAAGLQFYAFAVFLERVKKIAEKTAAAEKAGSKTAAAEKAGS